MTLDEQPWELLAAYFSGEIGEGDRAAVEAWRDAAPENGRRFAEAEAIWKRSGLKFGAGAIDDDVLWGRLKERMDGEARVRPLHGFMRKGALWQRVAAGIAVLCVFGYLLYWLNRGNAVVLTAGETVAMAYLPDSSRVWLNVNSSLTYAPDFGKGHRHVQLSGEGYFEVKPDAARPFVVAAGNALVRVKGTSFNVRMDSTAVALAVAEGTVQFTTPDSTKDGVMVKARERATLQGGAITKGRAVGLAFASWRYRHNPVFDLEKTNPGAYLTTQYTWHKNAINQSIVEGVLHNAATLARYSHIGLTITYTKPSGATGTAHVTVNQSVGPGRTIRFQKRLLDILTDTQSVAVAIESAVVEE